MRGLVSLCLNSGFRTVSVRNRVKDKTVRVSVRLSVKVKFGIRAAVYRRVGSIAALHALHAGSFITST